MLEERHVQMAREVLDDFERDLGLFVPSSVDSSSAILRAKADLERRQRGEIVGLPWADEWPALARRIGPIEPSSLTVIAARPSVGKSMFAMQLSRSLAAMGKRVMFVSRELSVVRLMRRNWVAYGGSMFTLKSGCPTPSDLQAIDTYDRESQGWDLHYDDHSKTVDEVRKEAEGLAPDIVIIDYLQRLAYDTEKEYAAITRIVNELQDFTLETEIPVVCLSQLSRPMKGNEWKPPSMSDVRGSGAVEERAANMVLLHRRWESVDDTDTKTAKVQTEDGWFQIEKCADGETGKPIPVRFNGARMTIQEKL